ncbi:methyl-accepting chemotaxis protein [Caldinitratiruptor microaerophilus]|uniref:Methyl-accepting chemotaxis protein n=1 Tax=Caldinitratiruptor microaerophilus TaxID=671077 RepID=A0AA35CHZ1_9FIRM|nr:methyl-accepting chemotaxis protein [Caldinitratiruptor microaerophilus]BDG59252.1 hypothetical protein caldi_03420 [Caldinitratiruptor microaerophilus]
MARWLDYRQWSVRFKFTATLVMGSLSTAVLVAGTLLWLQWHGGIVDPAVFRRNILYAALAASIPFVVSIFVGIGISILVATPLRAIRQAMSRVAQGDLRVDEVRTPFRDDMGLIAEAFGQMVADLRRVVGEMTQSAREVAAASRVGQESSQAIAQVAAELRAESDHLAEAAGKQRDQARQAVQVIDELRRAVRDVATGAQNQAAQASSGLEAIRQMASAIDQVAASAGQVAAAAQNAHAASTKGSRQIAQAVDGMLRVRDQVTGASDRIHALEASLAHVDEILRLITDVAEQTNLLALNAAIEAARAGEHGRGFAVVADEVRRLSERSREAAEQIGEQLRQLQASAREVVEAMSVTSREAEAGAQLGAGVRDALQSIIVAVEETDRAAQNISAAAQQLAASSQDVVRATEELAAIAEENSAASEEMLASAEEVGGLVGQMAEVAEWGAGAAGRLSEASHRLMVSTAEAAVSAGQLKDLSERLTARVSRFTT